MITKWLSPLRWLLAAGVIILHFSAKAQVPGTLDPSFNTSVGANSSVRAIALQPDGKILIGGAFTTYNSTSRSWLARVNPDGTLDAGFNNGGTVTGPVSAIKVQPDGKILVGTFAGSASGIYLTRLLSNGNYDPSFNTGTGMNGSVETIALQPDGKILIGGAFTLYNGTAARRLARLNPDGTLDSTFQLGWGANGYVLDMVVQPDGKIVIGGDFILYENVSCRRIARLNADGTLDQTFNPGNGADDYVTGLALQPDGKIVAVGTFIHFHTDFRNKIVRLNTDGSVDQSFNPGYGADFPIQTVALLPGGKIAIGGNFGYYNTTQRKYLAFLNSDGSLDSAFAAGSGPSQIIEATAVQPDGKVLIGGQFNAYNGDSLGYLARVMGPVVSALPEEVFPAFGVYPNPSNGQLTLDLRQMDQQDRLSLEVFTLIGQLVWQQALVPGVAQPVSLEQLPAGLYELRIQAGQSKVSRQLQLLR